MIKTQIFNKTNIITLSIFGSLIMTVSAQITIPLPFVPITGQTLGLFIVLSLLDKKATLVSVILYLAQGIAGIPVFAGGASGLSVLLGPSGGYLIGFIPAAYLTGSLKNDNTLIKIFKMIGGSIIIFGAGLLQLSIFVPKENLLSTGLYPFILGGIIKILIVAIFTNKKTSFK
ncbi:MAG: biotin transporter BioY [Brevinemataceae bacterium]